MESLAPELDCELEDVDEMLPPPWLEPAEEDVDEPDSEPEDEAEDSSEDAELVSLSSSAEEAELASKSLPLELDEEATPSTLPNPFEEELLPLLAEPDSHISDDAPDACESL